MPGRYALVAYLLCVQAGQIRLDFATIHEYASRQCHNHHGGRLMYSAEEQLIVWYDTISIEGLSLAEYKHAEREIKRLEAEVAARE